VPKVFDHLTPSREEALFALSSATVRLSGPEPVSVEPSTFVWL
jgi:hypothetical protein